MINNFSASCFVGHSFSSNLPKFNPGRMFEVAQIAPGDLEIRFHPEFYALLKHEADMFIGNLDDVRQKTWLEIVLHRRVVEYIRGQI